MKMLVIGDNRNVHRFGAARLKKIHSLALTCTVTFGMAACLID